MVPKIIHYCWFGGAPLPPIACQCIESWKLYLPNYEIKQWDESNFDISICKYVRQAYGEKKYAFVSDYARFWILYNYGGIYFDVDVELIRNLEDILSKGPYMGIEYGIMCNPGLGMAAERNMPFLLKVIESYNRLSFIKENGCINYTTVVMHVSELLKDEGLERMDEIQEIAGFKIYPQRYFCPLNYDTKELIITRDTYSIHHYNASWISKKHKIYRWLKFHMDKFFNMCCLKK